MAGIRLFGPREHLAEVSYQARGSLPHPVFLGCTVRHWPCSANLPCTRNPRRPRNVAAYDYCFCGPLSDAKARATLQTQSWKCRLSRYGAYLTKIGLLRNLLYESLHIANQSAQGCTSKKPPHIGRIIIEIRFSTI